MGSRSAIIALGLLLGLAPFPSLQAASGLSTEQRLERLERRVARITDLTLALDTVRNQNASLRGEIETLRHELEKLRRKQRDIYLDIDQRLQSARQGGGAPSGQVAAAAAPAATGTTGSSAPASSPQAASANVADPEKMQADYQAAYALLSPQVRRYDDAAKAFAAFVERYPGSELVPNAQYWLGEARYVAQKNKEALAAFDKLAKEYPDSAKVPGALYKIGRIHASAGEREKAIAAFKKVLKDYPSSPAAGLAKQQLGTLEKGR